MGLDIEARIPGQHLVLRGEVDVRTVADLRQTLLVSLEDGSGDLVVDCMGVRLVDATGLGALLSAHRRAQSVGRRLVLSGVQPDMVRLLHVARLGRLLGVEHRRAA